MSDTALLVVDMFNTYDHPDAEKLADSVVDIVDPVADLIARSAEREDVAVIYVNDNYGDFAAQPSDIVQAALDGARPELVRPVAPGPDTRFLTKVRHSAFYATSLDYLLTRLGSKRIVLTGQVTEQCILYTALDGYVRHYEVVVPPDAVAHIDAGLGKAALEMMERNMKAELSASTDCLP
ncbi:nicotinamidase-related amidase [Mycolicibacterium iranicum]|uniref:Nicotinamidase-related amidase n=1 Tax=Mycolicibacterium iranicum TaxID=912594 RepID=A0A839QBR5_MYCIR|nr:isochorismatase family cysteine hydrolase [Mycolicibacterium iranicum]MBB2993579.1 nicotinamidase-related amidase [Mycolicibacterium iranicum]